MTIMRIVAENNHNSCGINRKKNQSTKIKHHPPSCQQQQTLLKLLLAHNNQLNCHHTMHVQMVCYARGAPTHKISNQHKTDRKSRTRTEHCKLIIINYLVMHQTKQLPAPDIVNNASGNELIND